MAHEIVGAGKSKIPGLTDRLDFPARVDVTVLSPKAGLDAEFLHLQGTCLFS